MCKLVYLHDEFKWRKLKVKFALEQNIKIQGKGVKV